MEHNGAGNDTIHIRDLTLSCIIGVNPEERIRNQEIIINIKLSANLTKAGASDNIDDTANYKTMVDQISGIVENSQYYLVERLATIIAETCLTYGHIESATVRIEKPEAIENTRSVGVEIHRARSHT